MSFRYHFKPVEAKSLLTSSTRAPDREARTMHQPGDVEPRH